MSAILRFLVVLEALGLIGVPFAQRALGRLPGMGLGFARLLAWLVAAWGVWFVASLGVPHTTLLAALGCAAVAALAVVLHRRRPVRGHDPFTRRLWLWSEALFLVCFLAAVFVGGFSPDVWQTEHPLDMGLLNANLTGETMPPPDPWYSGEPLNYYYLGQNMVALAVRLIGVEPTAGYNLAVAAVFALLVSTSFTVAATIAEACRRQGLAIRRPLAAGAWCVVLLCLMGNLRAGWEALRASPLREFDWFGPTRIDPNTINEFPFFTWTLGDLHAHYIAAPLVLLSVAFAVQLAVNGPPRALSWETFGAALVIGWLYGAHSWSFPVAAGLLLAGGLIGAARVRGLLWAGATVVLAVVLVLPFIVTFEPNARGIGLTTTAMREPLGDFVSHHLLTDGTFLWLLLAPVAALALRARHRGRWVAGTAVVLAAAMLALSAANLAGAVLLVALVAVTFVPALLHGRPVAERALWLVAAGGFGCLLAAEVGLLQDEFTGTPFVRLNTVFKFSFHAWLLLAVFGAVVLAAARAWLPRRVGTAWLAVGVGLIAVGCAYVVPASYARRGAFADGPRLEGRTWLARMAPGDVRAIDWIRANTATDAHVVEAVGEEYSPSGYARMSTYTARPTVMGWEFHESQYNHPPETRRADVQALYQAPDAATVAQVVQRYDIDYAVVGPLELETYGEPAMLAQVGREVFSAQGTRIYAF